MSSANKSRANGRQRPLFSFCIRTLRSAPARLASQPRVHLKLQRYESIFRIPNKQHRNMVDAGFGVVPLGIPGTPAPFSLHILDADLKQLSSLVQTSLIGAPSFYNTR